MTSFYYYKWIVCCMFYILFIACGNSEKRKPYLKNKEPIGETGQVGYVDTTTTASINDVWNKYKIGELVTLDFSTLPKPSRTHCGGLGGVRFGDVGGIFREGPKCYGMNTVLEYLRRKNEYERHSKSKDSVFSDNWWLIIADDTGSGLKEFICCSENVPPIKVTPHHCTYKSDEKFERFIRSDKSLLCGYIALKNTHYIKGQEYCKDCALFDALEKMVSSSVNPSCSVVDVEVRTVAIVPVGDRY